MDDKIKKQIVIIVIIIILLILSLLALLIYAVNANDGNNVNITITTTTSSTTTTTTTLPILNSQLESDNSVIDKEVEIALNTYLENLKNLDFIGEYSLNEVTIPEIEEVILCPENGFDENKIYVNILLEYEQVNDTYVLGDNFSLEDGIVITRTTIVFSKEEDGYKFFSTYDGC